MTRYAIDEQRRALVAAWATGIGDTTSTVAVLPASCPLEQALAVARTASGLSEALWRTYTHPASSADDQMQEGSEAWQRQREREAFTKVPAAVVEPNLPENGVVLAAYGLVRESAHRLGRALHAIGDPALTKAVARDVEAELAAVEQAELGDLSGRSQQAVTLTREDASPVQVAAADRLLHENPLGSAELFTQVDPTAAAVAAAHWLYASAVVAAEASGHSVTRVIAEADDIEALPVVTPTAVLTIIDAGISPREAVTELIRDAMAVAEGRIPDPVGLAELFASASAQAEKIAPGDEDAVRAFLAAVRATPLDPSRPALDLLEDLLSGITGCALLHAEYTDPDETPSLAERADAADFGDDKQTDDYCQAADETIRELFLAAVREQAGQRRDRLV